MFAPYCPTCGHRVLLGTGRIVRAELDRPGAHRVHLRCHCGTTVRHDNAVPQHPVATNPMTSSGGRVA